MSVSPTPIASMARLTASGSIPRRASARSVPSRMSSQPSYRPAAIPARISEVESTTPSIPIRP